MARASRFATGPDIGPVPRSRLPAWARLLAFVLLCWLAWAAPTPARAQPLVDPAQVTTLDQVQMCMPGGVHEAIPGADCAWKTATLPHVWKPRLGVTYN